MPAAVDRFNLPFEEAIQYFKGKVKLPTERWDDLWQGMHSRAFVVAGGMRDDMLADMHQAVNKGIAEGTTLTEFRKDFDKIVERYGWQYKGGRNWRTAVIFNTNLSTAYHAGHYKQMTDPAVLKARPYWRYIRSNSANPREQHRGWHNTVLPADDPWWDTHYTPNGWGCKCGVVSLSERQVERLVERAKNTAHPVKRSAPPAEYYEWTDKAGKTHRIPKGIDPGWDYNVGKTAWGQKPAERAWQEGQAKYALLTPGDYKSAGRPERIPVDAAKASVGKRLQSSGQVRDELERLLGGAEKNFSFTAGGFRYDLLINAKVLADHLPPDRSPFLPFIPETIENPFEVWQTFEKNAATGQVVLRHRFIKAIQMEKERGIMLVLDAQGGFPTGWTMYPMSDLKALNKRRVGKLLWGREE